MTSAPSDSRIAKLDRYIASVAAMAIAALAATAYLEHRYWSTSPDWTLIGIFAAMLVAGELHSIGWLRLRDAGEVTAGWAFAFTLLLLGSPLASMAAMAGASVLPDLLGHKGLRRTAFNVSQTVLSLFAATIVLTSTGHHHALRVESAFTLGWMAAVLGAALSIFVANSLLTCGAIALHLGVPVRAILKRATGASVSADGALLVLPPLFVIAADFSVVTVPLLGLVAYLVYSSAMQALAREHRASHDHLTDLLNAPAFHGHVNGHLSRAGASARSGCVLLLDLNGFKTLNDRLGHHIGDAVLRAIGELLGADTPDGRVAARLGGDEFAIFIPDVRTVAAAIDEGRRLADRLGAPLDIDGFPISTSASIGAVLVEPGMSSSEEILRFADLAMYRAKRNRTGVEAHVSQPAAEASVGRIALLSDLLDALERDELWLAYQPQVNARTGRVSGFEALLRWTHPTRGFVLPSEFIGLAEHTDLVEAITERVLRLACRDAPALLALAPDIRIAVNVSASNLRSRHFARTVEQILLEHAVAPSSLEVEITESAFAAHEGCTIDVINELRSLGVGIAMDDFGAGYSSFARLMSMPIDYLKIDQSIVRNVVDQDTSFLVIGAIVDLCRAIGLKSVAEGVENIEMIHRLAAIGCDVVQGYAIARPMPVVDALRWLSDRPVGVPLALEGAR